MSTVFTEMEPATGGRYTNVSGADVVQDQFLIMNGKALRACEAVAAAAVGAFEKLAGKVIQVADFVTSEGTFATAGLPVFWNPADGKFSNTATLGYYFIGHSVAPVASGVLRVEVGAVSLVYDSAFRATATLTSAAGATPVALLADAKVPAGKKVYITGFFAKVNGATVWATTANVYVRDTNSSPVTGITMAVAALTANAFVTMNTANITIGDAVALGTGFTASKGLNLVANANGTGSDLVVTVTGFIA